MNTNIIDLNSRKWGLSLVLCWSLLCLSCAAETGDELSSEANHVGIMQCHGAHLVGTTTLSPHFTEIVVGNKGFGVNDDMLLHSTDWHPEINSSNPTLCTPYLMAWQQSNDCSWSNGNTGIQRTDLLMHWDIMRFDTHNSTALEPTSEPCEHTRESKSCQLDSAVVTSGLSIHQKRIFSFGGFAIGDALPVNIPGGGIAGRYYYSEDFTGSIDLTDFAASHIQFPCEDGDYSELPFNLTVYAEPVYVIDGELYTQPSLTSAATLRIQQELRVAAVPLREASDATCTYKDIVFRTDIENPSSFMAFPVRAPSWAGFIVEQAPIKDGKNFAALKNEVCSQPETEEDAPPPAACTLSLTDAQRSQCTANPSDCNAFVCAWDDADCQDACDDNAKRNELCCNGYQEGA